MQNFKFMPLCLLMFSINPVSYADHLNLPNISVEGVAGEVSPFALPHPVISSPDTGDLVRKLPGVNINNNGPITSIVQYRGLFGDRVNMLIDGVRINQAGPNRMDSPLSYLPASQVKDVAVYRGIAPVSSGIETIGGTITARSKTIDFGSGEKAEFHGNASAGYADNGSTRYAAVLAGISNQQHRLQLKSSLERGKNLKAGKGTIRPSQQRRDTLGIAYGYQQDGSQLELTVVHHDTGKSGTPALPMDIIFARGENYKFNFSRTLENGGKLHTRIHYQDADHRMSNYDLRTRPVMVNMMNMPMMRYVNADVKAKGLHLDYEFNHWTIGVDADKAKHNATIFNPMSNSFFINNYHQIKRDRYSLFTEWNTQMADNWQAQIGVRYSRIKMDAGLVDANGLPALLQINVDTLKTLFNSADRSQNENLFDLAATFSHKMNRDLDLILGLARKERAPSYQERYLWLPLESTSGLADGNNYVGNINLKKESAYQAELGFDWHTHEMAFTPRIFYHHINNYIQGTLYNTSATVNMINTMMQTGAQPATVLQFNNVDARLYGFDTNWMLVIADTWQLDGTISYVRGKRRHINDNLYRIAPLTTRTMLSYVQPTWRIGLEAETVAAQNKVSAENKEQKTAGYAVFNISGSYEANNAVTLSVGVNNLFDRNYTNHLAGYSRISNTDGSAVEQGERLPGSGRSAYISIKMNW